MGRKTLIANTMREKTKEVLKELVKYDEVRKFHHGAWVLGGHIHLDGRACEELYKDGFLELSWGNEKFTAYKVSGLGHSKLLDLDSDL